MATNTQSIDNRMQTIRHQTLLHIVKLQRGRTIVNKRVKTAMPIEQIIIIPFSNLILINPRTPNEKCRNFNAFPELKDRLLEYKKLAFTQLD
ncbi:MAG: hypothetical protein ABI851_16040 [Saprospiraceae bacterium]